MRARWLKAGEEREDEWKEEWERKTNGRGRVGTEEWERKEWKEEWSGRREGASPKIRNSPLE